MNLSELFEISVQNIIYSLGLLIVFLIGYFLVSKFKPTLFHPESNLSKVKTFLEKSLVLLTSIFVILIPLDLSFYNGQKIETSKTFNIQILFDVSLSMTAEDILPSRFDSAKDSVIKLVNDLEGYNISMITFSGIPFIWSPFSDDTNAIVKKLELMSLADFPPSINFVGTAIGDAILLGISNLSNLSKIKDKPGIIILITDGDSNRGSDPIDATKLSFDKNIPIYTLGIGSEDYIVGYDQYNQPVVTKINLELLQQISEDSGGEFYRILTDKEFKDIFDRISNYVKSEEKQIIYNDYINLNTYFYSLIGLFLVMLISIRLPIVYGLFFDKIKS